MLRWQKIARLLQHHRNRFSPDLLGDDDFLADVIWYTVFMGEDNG